MCYKKKEYEQNKGRARLAISQCTVHSHERYSNTEYECEEVDRPSVAIMYCLLGCTWIVKLQAREHSCGIDERVNDFDDVYLYVADMYTIHFMLKLFNSRGHEFGTESDLKK